LQSADAAIFLLRRRHLAREALGEVFMLCGLRAQWWPLGLQRRSAGKLLRASIALKPSALAVLAYLSPEIWQTEHVAHVDEVTSWASDMDHADSGILLGVARYRWEQARSQSEEEAARMLVKEAVALLPVDLGGSIWQSSAAVWEHAVFAMRLMSFGQIDIDRVINDGMRKGLWPDTQWWMSLWWSCVPILPSVGGHVESAFPELLRSINIIEAALPAIHRELLPAFPGILEELNSRWKGNYLLDDRAGFWKEHDIYSCDRTASGEKVEWLSALSNRSLLPGVCDVIAQIAGLPDGSRVSCDSEFKAPLREGQMVRIIRGRLSIVGPPRSKINFHRSREQGRLRVHCPIIVPNGSMSALRLRDGLEVSYSKEGSCFLFDESTEHEMTYTGEDYRVALYFDVVHPALTRPAAAAECSPRVRTNMYSAPYFAERLRAMSWN